jgi:PQQ-like domain
VNNEERKLADVLHRVTPEPTRPVTVEQVAYRLVSEPSGPRLGRQGGGREPRPRRAGFGLSRAFAPALAAAAVVVIAGAGAGIAVLANSHHNPPSSAGGATASATDSSATATASSSPSPAQSSTEPARGLAGLPWGAELIDHQAILPGSLVSAGGSLYAFGNGTLDRIDPATGAVVDTAQFSPAILNPPVVIGNTVWVVSSYTGGLISLQGYNASTLAKTSSVQVPAIGGVSTGAQGVLAAGPDGNLYVAAGDVVAVVSPSGQVSNQIYVTGGKINSLAVSPDGSKLYLGTEKSTAFKLLVYGLQPHPFQASSSTLTQGGGGGNLVATSGGVWGTTGSGHSEWVWFAPGGDLTRAVRVGAGAGGGFTAYPSYSGGAVWVGGDSNLVCASPATGQVLASAAIPGDQGAAQFLASPVVSGGRAYSYYQTDASQQSGVARVSPPAACTGNVSS